MWKRNLLPSILRVKTLNDHRSWIECRNDLKFGVKLKIVLSLQRATIHLIWTLETTVAWILISVLKFEVWRWKHWKQLYVVACGLFFLENFCCCKQGRLNHHIVLFCVMATKWAWCLIRFSLVGVMNPWQSGNDLWPRSSSHGRSYCKASLRSHNLKSFALKNKVWIVVNPKTVTNIQRRTSFSPQSRTNKIKHAQVHLLVFIRLPARSSRRRVGNWSKFLQGFHQVRVQDRSCNCTMRVKIQNPQRQGARIQYCFFQKVGLDFYDVGWKRRLLDNVITTEIIISLWINRRLFFKVGHCFQNLTRHKQEKL